MSDTEHEGGGDSPSRRLEEALEVSYSAGGMREEPERLSEYLDLAVAIKSECSAVLECDTRITKATRTAVSDTMDRMVRVVERVVGLNGFLIGRVAQLKESMKEVRDEFVSVVMECVKGELGGFSGSVNKLVKDECGTIIKGVRGEMVKLSAGVTDVVRGAVKAGVGECVTECVTGVKNAVGESAGVVKSVVNESVVEMKKVCEGVTKGSYALAVKKDEPWQVVPNFSMRKLKPRKPEEVVLLFPENKEGTSEDTRKKVREVLNPRRDQLSCRGVRNIRDGGVAVVLGGRGDVEKVKANEGLRAAGVRVAEPRLQRPRVLIYDVPKEVSKDELAVCVWDQGDFVNVEREEFINGFREVSRVNAREGECNIVVECSPRVRECLRMKGRVGIEWNYCRVVDFVRPMRCFKCLGFGHMQDGCREKVACAHCGGEHLLKDCGVKKTERMKCVNCMRIRKPCEHDVRGSDCPVYKRALERTVMRTNYEC